MLSVNHFKINSGWRNCIICMFSAFRIFARRYVSDGTSNSCNNLRFKNILNIVMSLSWTGDEFDDYKVGYAVEAEGSNGFRQK